MQPGDVAVSLQRIERLDWEPRKVVVLCTLWNGQPNWSAVDGRSQLISFVYAATTTTTTTTASLSLRCRRSVYV